MRDEKLFLIFACILLWTISFPIVSSIYTESLQSGFYLGSQSGFSSSSFLNTGNFYDSSYCKEGNDFMLQVDSLGCTPAVVRSDLLEEQGVAVFCPINSIKLNPMLQIDSFKSVMFSRDYDSRYVSGVTFFPYRSALSTQTTKWLNSETPNNIYNNNIGYAVVYLRQQQNESAMPDYVNINLTATLRYNSKNVFGLKGNSFYLPILDDEQWNLQKDKYSFFEGRGYLRAEEISSDKATISFYSYANNAPIQGDVSKPIRLFTRNLEKGQSSDLLYIPGYGCNTGFKITLNNIENPGTFVKLKINSEYQDLREGDYFLSEDNEDERGNCYVKSGSVVNYGLVKQIIVNCNTLVPNLDGDLQRKNRDFPLYVSPNFDISVDGVKKSYGVGELITTYKAEDSSDAGIYLGYAGLDKNDNDKLKLVLIAVNSVESKLSDDLLKKSAMLIERSSVKLEMDIGFSGFFSKFEDSSILSFDKGDTIFHLKTFNLKGYSDGSDVALEGLSEKYYKNSTKEFDKVINEYYKEKYPNNDAISLSQKASREKIILAKALNQRTNLLILCNEYKKKYPNDKEFKECNNLNKNIYSNEEIITTGETEQYTISLEDIYEPSFLEYGIEIIVKNLKTNTISTFQISKGESVFLSNDGNSYIQLENIYDENNVVVYVKVPEGVLESKDKNSQQRTRRTYGSVSLQKGKAVFIEDYSFSVKTINLKKYARVSINSAQNYDSSKANFHFRIDIEKRAIQLSPDKIKEKISSLNKSIGEWSRISDSLGSVVKGLKTACIASDAVLTLKHLVSDSGGKGIARTEVMTGSGGWNERCAKMVENKEEGYKTIEDCLYKNSNKIDKEVDDYYSQMSKQNEQIEKIQNKYKKNEGLFGGKTINTNEFVKDYSKQVLSSLTGTIKDPNDDKKIINLADYQKYLSYDSYNKTHDYSVEDLRQIDLYNRLKNSATDTKTREIYEEKLANVLNSVKSNYESTQTLTSVQQQYKGFGYAGPLSKPRETFSITNTITFKEAKDKNLICGSSCSGACGNLNSVINDDTKIIIIQDTVGSGTYLFTLNDNYAITRTYSVVDNGCLENYTGMSSGSAANLNDYASSNPFGIQIQMVDKFAYSNKYLNPELKYYDREPYKGLPALVPFDKNNGWYAYIKQTLPIVQSAKASYEESGKVTSFFICNVGKNGLEEFNSVSKDDLCVEVNEGIGQPYNQFGGLSESEATNIISKARAAIQTASSSKYKGAKKGTTVNINGFEYKVGDSAVDIPLTQCTDFMSPKECQLLFNVCDPVICPSSRCDFGGAYPVKDVIQSGIIGSLVLCLPNWNQGVYIPVCLTGVKAGLDSWISVMQSYRGCLQENLDTGKTIGICDEINSVYMCEFFWRQAFPIAKLAIPKILSVLAGQNSRGGGEYMGVQAAWENAQNSINYFVQNYALNSFNAFKYRSAEQIGSEVCNKFVSLSYPNGIDIFDQITEPDSPSQFYGRFDEIPFTTATNPAISHYKVFYHIYAGNDRGAYYRVYLTGADSSSSVGLEYGRMVASDYINKGDYKTETLDFTAPSGYKQLCINVNGDEECGFSQVTTNFATDYVKDQYIKSQATENSVTTEKACVSGTANIYNLLNPNIEEGFGNLIDPQIYNQGIIRICATENPEKTSDTNIGNDKQRWREVGYCGDRTLKCWLDTQSLPNAFIFETSYDQTLDKLIVNSIDENFGPKSTNQYYNPVQFEELIKKISETNVPKDNEKNIGYINSLFEKTFFSNEIAYLHFMKGIIYGKLAKSYFEELQAERDLLQAERDLQSLIDNCNIDELIKLKGINFLKNKLESRGIGTSNIEEEDIKNLFRQKICSEVTQDFSSVWFEYNDGLTFTSGGNPILCFKYFNKQWKYFADNCKKLTSTTNWISASDFKSEEFLKLSNTKKDLVQSVFQSNYKRGVNVFQSNYKRGVKVLVDEILKGTDGNNNKHLLTKYALLKKSGLFSFEIGKVEYPQDIYVRYNGESWLWSTGNNVKDENTWTETPKIADNEADKIRIISIFEGNEEIKEHYEQGIISYLGNPKKNFEDGYLHLLQGDFVLSRAIEKKPDAVVEEMQEYSLNADGPCKSILDILEKINGKFKSVVRDLDNSGSVDCHDSVLYIYKQAFDMNKKCVYSDIAGKKYTILIKKVEGTITTEDANANSGASFLVNPNACENKNLNEEDKLNILSPGDILSIYFGRVSGADKPHNVIFVEWVNKEEKLAKIFDWGAFSLSGNFEYSNLNISDNAHPVYMVWEPVFSDPAKKNIECYKLNQEYVSESKDVFLDVTESPKFRMETTSWLGIDILAKDICFKYFDNIWHWTTDCDNVGETKYYTNPEVPTTLSSIKSDWISVESTGNGELSDSNIILVSKLRDKKSFLKEGLQILIDETKDKGYSLVAGSTIFSHNIFFVEEQESRDDLYFNYNEKWMYGLGDTKYLGQYEEVDGILNQGILSEKQISLIQSLIERDFIQGAKILFWYDPSDEDSISQKKSESTTISLEQAMYESRELEGDYSDFNINKNFVDKICNAKILNSNAKILNSNECDEIKGVGFWNAEESMDWVKNLLIQKKIQKNGGKWSIISALLKTYLIEGSYTDNADLIYNWRKQNVLDENFYNALDRNSEDIVSVLRDYLIKEYKSESSSDSSSSVSSTKIFNVIKRM